MPTLGLPNLFWNLDSSNLIRVPNLEEVKNVIFTIESNKTPGPDGPAAWFFKNYWYIVKKELFNCILDFFF